jgi:hypothetical protein
MNNLFNNQLKILSFHKNTCLPQNTEMITHSSVTNSSLDTNIISRSSLVINKNVLNLTKNKYGLIFSHYQNQLFIGSLWFMFSRLFNNKLSCPLAPLASTFIRTSLNRDDKIYS